LWKNPGAEYLKLGPLDMHRKKRLGTFSSPAGMSLAKLSLGGNNLIVPAQEMYAANLFLPCAKKQWFFQ
jgi:hypothetical protein